MVVLTAPSVMVSELACAFVSETTPESVYWLVTELQTTDVIAISSAGRGVRTRVNGVMAVQPLTFVLMTEKLLTPALRLTAEGLAIVPLGLTKTFVKPSKALVLWLAVKIALRLTGVPTVAHKLRLVGCRAGKGLTTMVVCATVAVAKQVELLLTITVNVFTPTVSPVARALAEFVEDNVTLGGALTVYE